MMGNRWRRIALITAAFGAVALTGIGVLIVIEAGAHLGGFSPITFDWRSVAGRLDDVRLGERWVVAAAAGLVVVGVWLLLASITRRSRRRVPLALVPADLVVTLDAADARSAVVEAAKSVPAVDGASARWTIRKRVRVKVRYQPSDTPPGRDVDDLVKQRVADDLERLGMRPRRGVKVKRSRRSP